MTKFLLTTIVLSFLSLSYAQNKEYNKYQFKINLITNPDDAKEMITQMRKKVDEIIFYFDNSTNVFTLKTYTQYTNNEFIEILISHNFNALEP